MPTVVKGFRAGSHAATFETDSVTIDGTDDVVAISTDIGISRGWAGICCLEIDNETGGGAALSDFTIQLRDHPAGEWYSYLSGTDFDNDNLSNLLWVFGAVDNTSPRPHVLADADRAHIIFRVNGANSFRFLASVASGSTDIIVRGTLANLVG